MKAINDIKALTSAFRERVWRIDTSAERTRALTEDNQRRLQDLSTTVGSLSGQVALLSGQLDTLISNNTVLMEAFAVSMGTSKKRSRQAHELINGMSVKLDKRLGALSGEVAGGLAEQSAGLDRDRTQALQQVIAALDALATTVDATSDKAHSANQESLSVIADAIGTLGTRLTQVGDVALEAKAIGAEAVGALAAISAPLHRIQAGLAWGGGAEAWPDPELVMLTSLAGRLRSATMIDVGAHKGDYSAPFLDAGFKVFALEPNPQVFEQLEARLGATPGFTGINVAAADADGEGFLHLATDTSPDGLYNDATLFSSLVQHSMPDDLPFGGSLPVRLRSLSSLVEEGALPAAPGILKIDVEGFELQVLGGAKGLAAEVVLSEFWSKDSMFGRSAANNDPAALRELMLTRGYSRSITFARRHGSTAVRYLVNIDAIPADSWGNIVFFAEEVVFERALKWCAGSLSRETLDHQHPHAE